MDLLDRGGNQAVQKQQTEHKIELRELSVNMLAVAFKESLDNDSIKAEFKTLDDAMKDTNSDAA